MDYGGTWSLWEFSSLGSRRRLQLYRACHHTILQDEVAVVEVDRTCEHPQHQRELQVGSLRGGESVQGIYEAYKEVF